MVPVFQEGDLCVIMEKLPHKTLLPQWFRAKFYFFLVVIHANCVVPVFHEGDLCAIMEKRPHKTHCLSSFVQISKLRYRPRNLVGEVPHDKKCSHFPVETLSFFRVCTRDV